MNYLSMKYLAWEFALFLWSRINFIMSKNIISIQRDCHLHGGFIKKPQLRVLLRLMMLSRQQDVKGYLGMRDNPIDESIYSRNGLLQLVHNSKPEGVLLRFVCNCICNLKYDSKALRLELREKILDKES